MNKILLYIIMLPSAIWRNLGADTKQLKAILDVKLKLDDRKPLSFGRRQQKKKSRFNSILNMLISFFMGFIYIYPLLIFKDHIYGLFGYFSIFLFILTFSLITDFANVIFDVKDKYILLSKPIDDRTLFLSRLLHVFIYLFRVVLPMSLPGWIIIGIDMGWKAALIFPIPLLLLVFMALFLVNACYLTILKLSRAERFQKVLYSFQIAFSVFIIAFYYLLQAVMNNTMVRDLDLNNYTWIKFTPPYWLASCWTWIGYTTTNPNTKWFSILAIVIPLTSLWATIKWLAPSFAKKIATLDSIDPVPQSVNQKKVVHGNKLYNTLARYANKNDAAKAGFIITWLQTSRSRNFKMRVYPTLVTVPVYFLYLILMSESSLATVWEGLPETKSHLGLLYMSGFALLQAMGYVTMSDQYKASWIYFSAPIEAPGNVMIGAFRALWLRYFLPFISFLSIFILYVWGISSILDILLAIVNVTLFALCIMRISYRAFPFSLMEQMNNTAGKTIVRVLFTFFLIGILGLGHYLAMYFWWLKLLLLTLSALFFWLVWDSYKNTDWKSLKTAEGIK